MEILTFVLIVLVCLLGSASLIFFFKLRDLSSRIEKLEKLFDSVRLLK